MVDHCTVVLSFARKKGRRKTENPVGGLVVFHDVVEPRSSHGRSSYRSTRLRTGCPLVVRSPPEAYQAGLDRDDLLPSHSLGLPSIFFRLTP